MTTAASAGPSNPATCPWPRAARPPPRQPHSHRTARRARAGEAGPRRELGGRQQVRTGVRGGERGGVRGDCRPGQARQPQDQPRSSGPTESATAAVIPATVWIGASSCMRAAAAAAVRTAATATPISAAAAVRTATWAKAAPRRPRPRRAAGDRHPAGRGRRPRRRQRPGAPRRGPGPALQAVRVPSRPIVGLAQLRRRHDRAAAAPRPASATAAQRYAPLPAGAHAAQQQRGRGTRPDQHDHGAPPPVRLGGRRGQRGQRVDGVVEDRRRGCGAAGPRRSSSPSSTPSSSSVASGGSTPPPAPVSRHGTGHRRAARGCRAAPSASAPARRPARRPAGRRRRARPG